MRSRGKPKRAGLSPRSPRWEYLFHPSANRSSAGLSLTQLQDNGWVIQSTSRSEKGRNVYLLKRAKSDNPDKTEIQE